MRRFQVSTLNYIGSDFFLSSPFINGNINRLNDCKMQSFHFSILFSVACPPPLGDKFSSRPSTLCLLGVIIHFDRSEFTASSFRRRRCGHTPSRQTSARKAIINEILTYFAGSDIDASVRGRPTISHIRQHVCAQQLQTRPASEATWPRRYSKFSVGTFRSSFNARQYVRRSVSKFHFKFIIFDYYYYYFIISVCGNWK
jgi:hypothetical protein